MTHRQLTFEEKTRINFRFTTLYDEGMASGKHGQRETTTNAMHQAYREFFDGTLPELDEYPSQMIAGRWNPSPPR